MTDAPSSPLHPEGEDLLHAALSDAFSVPDLPRAAPPAAPQLPTENTPTPPPPAEPAPAPSASAAEHAVWQAQYDAQLAEWRRQSAEQRARAEAERARWEARRAAEGSTAATTESWTNVGASVSSSHAEPSSSPADARDLVTGEAPRAPLAEARETGEAGETGGAGAHAQERSHTSSSPRWEDVPSSLTSSFPSLSFPETSQPHSPHSSQAQPHPDPHSHPHSHPAHHPAHAPAAAPSATLAVFDDTLSPRTRAWALLSSLGVNLLLPFVNGVMLGFGEIFAKTVVVGWLGWRVPGNVGLGVPPPVRKERK
ncbi:hypothetical protein BV25DRAFT_1913927 [Artomyces pyxidatus]|uniref:Uncharacterized protein n=1 Tax=Artomyces pyxidatus TaxID=48021 RepID=A0ACB8T890_9AGAM|nr:hypothetical protein BV25DRAFT_1913927 [Artomyces pyxidatus]